MTRDDIVVWISEVTQLTSELDEEIRQWRELRIRAQHQAQRAARLASLAKFTEMAPGDPRGPSAFEVVLAEVELRITELNAVLKPELQFQIESTENDLSELASAATELIVDVDESMRTGTDKVTAFADMLEVELTSTVRDVSGDVKRLVSRVSEKVEEDWTEPASGFCAATEELLDEVKDEVGSEIEQFREETESHWAAIEKDLSRQIDQSTEHWNAAFEDLGGEVADVRRSITALIDDVQQVHRLVVKGVEATTSSATGAGAALEVSESALSAVV